MIIVYLFESTYDSTRNYLSETSRLPWRIYSMVSIRLEFLVCTALPVYLAPPGKFSYLHVAGKTVSLVAGLNVSRWVACICLQRKNSLELGNAAVVFTALRLIRAIAMYNELMSCYAHKQNYQQLGLGTFPLFPDVLLSVSSNHPLKKKISVSR